MLRFRLGSLAMMVVMIGALLLVLLVEGCSTSSTGTSATATPKGPYGSLTIAGHFGSGGFDPLTASGETFQGLGLAIFDTLVYYDDDDKLVPGIAERWEIASDGLSHTFYIRKGVKFHNGDELTGADVKFSIERMLGPESVNQDAAPWRGAVDKVELKDDYTVVLRMKVPQFDQLKGIDGGMTAVLPKKYFQEKGVEYFFRNPVGSGPWKLLKFEPGNRAELEAVDSHWRALPQFKNITLVAVKEEASLVAQLKTGELDMAMVSTDSVPALKAAGIRIVSFDRGLAYYIWPFFDVDNPKSSPLGDVRVRKALQLAINSKEMADKLFNGNGGPQVMAFVRPTAYFWDSSVLKLDPFDPEGAKKLLAEAGYPTGFNSRLYEVGEGGPLSTVNLALDGYWRKIGINSEIVPMQFSAFRPKFSPKVAPEIWNSIFTYRTNGYRDFEGVSLVYHSTKSNNKNTKNSKVDELIDKVPQTRDLADKKKMALEAVRLGKEEYTTLPVVAVYPTLGISSKIGEVKKRVVASIFATTYESITHSR